MNWFESLPEPEEPPPFPGEVIDTETDVPDWMICDLLPHASLDGDEGGE